MENKESGLVPADVQIGEYLYDHHGSEYEYIGVLDGMFGKQHCARPVYEDFEGQDTGDIAVVYHQLFRDPPDHRKHEKIAALQAEYEELQTKMNLKYSESLKLKDEVRDLKRLAEHSEQLRHVIAFIEHRITHVVAVAYDKAHIYTWEEFKKSGFTHLGLYAVTYRIPGNPYAAQDPSVSEWRAKQGRHHYEDKCWSDVYPCESYEEAKSRVEKLYAKAVEYWNEKKDLPGSPSPSHDIEKLCKAFDWLKLPEGFDMWRYQKKRSEIESTLEHHQRQVEAQQKRLDSIIPPGYTEETWAAACQYAEEFASRVVEVTE